MNKIRNIDPTTTLIPFSIIAALCMCLALFPENSTLCLTEIRIYMGERFGVFYLICGLGIFLVSLWIAFSDLGSIKLGHDDEQPRYTFFSWGAMVFTCGLAADIVFYSFSEWISYAQESYVLAKGSFQLWGATYPLFHWGFIPWSIYAVLSACFGFMLHVRIRHKQKYSEACRAILGDKTDRWQGKCIDVIAVFALIAGTATTFSVATPLLSKAVMVLLGIPDSKFLTIFLLATTCLVYTLAVLKGMKAVSILADSCMYLFAGLLLYVFIFGGEPTYIVETGFAALGNMVQNFIGLSTWTDPLRETGFPQNWTMFFWAYWMVWGVASPFFMGKISRGRTIKQTILGTYIFGVSSTLISFIILGNYGLGLKMHGVFDAVAYFTTTGNTYQTVMAIIEHLPLANIFLFLLVITMIAFYATSFDSITLVASQYSYKKMSGDEEADGGVKLFWSILLIMLPIALIFSESSMNNLQTVSIIAAFPIALVILLIIVSFIKDGKDFLKDKRRGG